jgi:hypothetical protein
MFHGGSQSAEKGMRCPSLWTIHRIGDEPGGHWAKMPNIGERGWRRGMGIEYRIVIVFWKPIVPIPEMDPKAIFLLCPLKN